MTISTQTTSASLRGASQIHIEGTPALAGRIITQADPELLALRTLQEHAEFASKLRGQFAIIIRDAHALTAITDFAGTLPIYYTEGGRHISGTLAALRSSCSGQISREGLFFYAARGGVGIDPLYAGVKQVLPASVMQFSNGVTREIRYIDWCGISEQPYDLDVALERFTEISCSFLKAVTCNEERVGCLLSGGTDSAVAAWLLQRVHPRVTCFTADYAIGRYSEYEAAHAHAVRLGLEHKRVLVRRPDHWRALTRMNSADSDQPASHSQLTSLLTIADAARDLWDKNTCQRR